MKDQHAINQAFLAEIANLRAENLITRKICAMLIAEICRSATDPQLRAEEMIAMYESLQFDAIAQSDLQRLGMQQLHKELDQKEEELFALARKWVKLIAVMRQSD
ncbi:hypothetical protein IP68_04695 [Blastomonas sp. AAP25]|uniref:hypothetical protein n=1 Tax=Blastomonas sp. AAP25 TaxID=1523416 RepID=UPI0006B8DFFE|nr:hypothetical protein [Blastomonas sp. AAP25]KPF75841.1 hypothetical protein IP68_04695 [Blastomonas sp. AAP25]